MNCPASQKPASYYQTGTNLIRLEPKNYIDLNSLHQKTYYKVWVCVDALIPSKIRSSIQNAGRHHRCIKSSSKPTKIQSSMQWALLSRKDLPLLRRTHGRVRAKICFTRMREDPKNSSAVLPYPPDFPDPF